MLYFLYIIIIMLYLVTLNFYLLVLLKSITLALTFQLEELGILKNIYCLWQDFLHCINIVNLVTLNFAWHPLDVKIMLL